MSQEVRLRYLLISLISRVRLIGAPRLSALFLIGGLVTSPTHAAQAGIQFQCGKSMMTAIQEGMTRYFQELRIPASLYSVTVEASTGHLTYTLATPPGDRNTLNLQARPEFDVGEEKVELPRIGQKPLEVRTVARKEIALALMQHGRLTVFKEGACDVQALKDQIALRQNIVAWSEHLHWVWPNGGTANWNTRYWIAGTPLKNRPLHEALLDAFSQQNRYAIGCYTATKLVIMQGVVDYYRRVRANDSLAELVLTRIEHDGDPLVHVEPANMWDFEADFDLSERDRPGKLVKIQYGVAPQNFVPGDWVYIVNTDPDTHHKTGYEGSNAIYLGRNRFDDFYDDHDHAYSYEEKLSEVYQWRNGVFSRSRDAAKIQPLGPDDFQRLGQRPAQGGLVKGYRVVPYLFGYEALPALHKTD